MRINSFTKSKSGTSKELVIILHAYSSSPDQLTSVKKNIIDKLPEADIFVPSLKTGRFSFATPNSIVIELLKWIDEQYLAHQKESSQSYERIILIGHSIGAILARKLYVIACGENENAPFEKEFIGHKENYTTARIWAGKVERLVLLAAMNRGWQISHHMGIFQAISWWIGSIISNIIYLFTPHRFLIYSFKRGSKFITQLKIQWLELSKFNKDLGIGKAFTVQLLGTIDDMVAPEDNIDLVSGKDFIYLEVPKSGHKSIIEMGNTPDSLERRNKFLMALNDSQNNLKLEKIFPADYEPKLPNKKVTHVVFVIHGIRDKGYWTQRVGRKIVEANRIYYKTKNLKYKRTLKIETSSYGYFPMLPFLLPNYRRKKVQWLMDRYTENKALYPNAKFSFFGHSNGTYLLAKALTEYPACKFEHVAFAGSVVNRDFDWYKLINNKQVKEILNYVATNDWVVAIFPKFFQTMRIQDLGSAGYDGFSKVSAPHIEQVEYIVGKHSAALVEDNWNAIANFIIGGHNYKHSSPPTLIRQKRSGLLNFLSFISPLIWLVGLALMIGLGYLIFTYSPHGWEFPFLFLYIITIWNILTRL